MPSLNWIGKEKIVNHHQDVPFRVLEHVYGFTPDGEQKEATNSGNLIIEGDNLEALKALLPEYEGRINCVYIDPPYNTGEEKWKYNDNVNHPKIKKWLGEIVGKEMEDFSRHDKWLCMMYPRLKLIQKLLDSEGVLFISIDDHEVNNLLTICNEIFGKKNQVAMFTWEKKKKGSHLNSWITTVKEYVLVFCKDYASFKGLIGQVVNHKETYPCINPGNTVSSRIIPKGVKSTFKSKDHFLHAGSIISAGNMSLELETDLELENGFLKNDVTIKSEWRYGQDKLDGFAKTNELYFTRDLYLRREVTEPRYKMLKDWLPRVDNTHLLDLKSELIKLYEEDPGNHNDIEEIKNQIQSIESSTFLDFDTENLNSNGWGSNEDGDDENRKIFGSKVFDFPKPSKLIAKLICSYRKKDAIILDSFAGSGTTAHAVLSLNKKDNGNRKVILIEMEDYSNNITAERVKRVIKGYEDIEGIDSSFDYLQLGEPIFNSTGNLNEKVGEDKIRGYIYYTETKQLLKRIRSKENWYILENFKNTGIYFYYEPEKFTTLDLESLSIVKEKQEQYIIYADHCLLDPDYMLQHNIIFKKIPRDIKRF
ncbi:MAG: site-specific DNA-methyltransferase [Flavobacteriia bacterium]|nr:site-specific DNA-methyltransferase [Flavobacteriia bacterium]